MSEKQLLKPETKDSPQATPCATSLLLIFFGLCWNSKWRSTQVASHWRGPHLFNPSLPQPVQFPGWKVHAHACKQYFFGPITNYFQCCAFGREKKSLRMPSEKEDKKAYEFQFSHFCWLFSSDIMAVKRLTLLFWQWLTVSSVFAGQSAWTSYLSLPLPPTIPPSLKRLMVYADIKRHKRSNFPPRRTVRCQGELEVSSVGFKP